MPFPPNCCMVSCSCTTNSISGNEVASVSGFEGLSSLMKNHSPRGRRARKNGNNRRDSVINGGHSPAFRANSTFSAMSLHRYLAFSSSTSMPIRQHLLLSCFLSSLSHHCTSPAPSSIDDDCTWSSFQFESSHNDYGSNGEGQAINDGLNNYGMIKHGLFKTRK